MTRVWPISLPVFALMFFAGSTLPADVITYTGTGGRFNQDSWNIATNWSSGIVPAGVVDVRIESGRTAHVQSSATVVTPGYDGSLTIESNAALELALNSTVDDLDRALGTNSVFMQNNSRLIVRTNTTIDITEDFVLQGDSRIDLGISTSGANHIRVMSGNISGTGKLGIGSAGGQRIDLFGNNTFSGGLFIGDNDGVGFGNDLSVTNGVRLVAGGSSSLGTGDVQLGDEASLIIDAQNAMNAMSELRLFGVADRFFSKLILNEDLIVSRAIIDGISLANGIYDTNSGLQDVNGFNLITGTGVLQVGSAAVPEPSSIAIISLGVVIFLGRAHRKKRLGTGRCYNKSTGSCM